MSKKIVKKVGRPTKIDEAVVLKLEQAFSVGSSDTEACSFAGISRPTYYNYIKQNPDFLNRVQLLKTKLPLRAKNELARMIQGGNEKAVFWYLDRYEKRDKDEEQNKASRMMLEQSMEQELSRLLELRQYTPQELDTLNEYALCIAQVKVMRTKLAEEGETLYSDKTGGVYTNPLYNQLQSVQNRMDRLRDVLFPVSKEIKVVKDIRDEFR